MPTPKNAKALSLEQIYEALENLLSSFTPPLEAFSRKIPRKRNFSIRIPKAVSIPPAYGGKPVQLDLASVILQEGYVGFYFMPVYMNPSLRKKLAPALLKTLKGKTCFHIKKLDDSQLANIEFALCEGVKCYKTKGWL
ncbi:MAG TPA: hypothetical protein VJR23_19540 [Candidatus Acidoferrales bacterium]|nr:hypothetical protein [Candidatus Acidoferrales bacterium]